MLSASRANLQSSASMIPTMPTIANVLMHRPTSADSIASRTVWMSPVSVLIRSPIRFSS